jgi:hypothetical protein
MIASVEKKEIDVNSLSKSAAASTAVSVVKEELKKPEPQSAGLPPKQDNFRMTEGIKSSIHVSGMD